jgi:[ribosomal protein S18]-alanine N-acetyltransferase
LYDRISGSSLKTMSTSPLNIRPISKSDFEKLYSIDQACFPQGIAYTRWELRWFLSRQGALGYVAELGAAELEIPVIAGFIVAWLKKRKAAHIITLDVLEPYRRQSVGKTLMQKVEEDFRREAVRVVILEVAVSNTTAQHFYKQFGFEVAERLENYYPNIEDAFEMVWWLS